MAGENPPPTTCLTFVFPHNGPPVLTGQRRVETDAVDGQDQIEQAWQKTPIFPHVAEDRRCQQQRIGLSIARIWSHIATAA